MESFLALAMGNEADYFREILSLTVFEHLSRAVESAGGTLFLASRESGVRRMTPEEFAKTDGREQVMLILQPAAGLSADAVARLTNQDETACLLAGRTPVAVFGRAQDVRALDLNALPGKLAQVQTPPMEALAVTDTESAYAVQEQLRRRINMELMQSGVMVVDPNSTHVSPAAKVAPGCTILPGCLIYGHTEIGGDSVIGPNALLRDAHIGCGCTVNASQITDSTVGDHTTVGPFAYIRPGCTVGQNVRIGDFVEVKNSAVGDGTKISHLTYIGDSDFGKDINVGCGVVTVNYDGREKHRTVVEDGSFIGCNVNLVAPVRIKKGAYLAAGGTVTRDVPEDSLVIARSRATVKEDWAKGRFVPKKSGN